MWSTLSSFGLLSARKPLTGWKESSKGPPSWSGTWNVSSEERLRAGLARSSKEKVKREELIVCVYFMGGYREDRVGVLLEVDSDRMRSYGNKL